MSKKPVIELATVQYSDNRENTEVNQITEIVFRVFGGKSHNERVAAATDALESYTEFFSESENTVISVDSYECKQKFTANSVPYVEFHYGNFQITY